MNGFDFDGKTTNKRHIDLSGRRGRNKNEFLTQRNKDREEREKQRIRWNSAIIIQSGFRSYLIRKIVFRDLRQLALAAIQELILDSKHKKQTNNLQLNKIISIVTITSKLKLEDDLITYLFTYIISAKDFCLEKDRLLTIGYFINEILKYISSLCNDFSPRLGPPIRVLEKILDISPSSFNISSQLGMFSIFEEILCKILPHGYNDDEANPKAFLIYEFMLRLLKKNQYPILVRCFLRDFVGANGSIQKSYYSGLAVKFNNDLAQKILVILIGIKKEPIKIVSYGFTNYNHIPTFGAFVSNKIVYYNKFHQIPVTPDAALLHFLLLILEGKHATGAIEIVTWISKFVNISSSSSAKEYDEDSDDEEEWFITEVMLRSSFTEKHKQCLQSFLVQQNYSLMSSDAVFNVARLLFTFNDSTVISRLAFDRSFQLKLLERCIQYGKKEGTFSQSTTFIQRVQQGLQISVDEFNEFRAAISLFCDVARIGLVSLSDQEFSSGKFVVPVSDLSCFISNMCKLVIGVIRSCFNVRAVFLTDNFFQLVIPLSKLLRSILDRTARLPDMVDASAWNVDFHISDYSVLKRQNMLSNNDLNSVVVDVSKNFNDGTAYEKQLMSILSFVPFTVNFDKRLDIFYSIVNEDLKKVHSQIGVDGRFHYHRFTVRRDHLYEDAYSEMSDANFPDWRRRFAVQFRSDGRVEAGVGQGVNSEFLEDLLATGFDPNRGLFLANQNGELYPNPGAATIYPDTYRQHYRFLGKILGRLIFQRSLVKLPLASFFISKLLRGNTNIDMSELQSLDTDLYKNLMYIKNHPQEVSGLTLDFTATLGGSIAGNQTINLIPNGGNVAVTEENYTDYIIRMADYHLNRSIHVHCAEFRDGFNSIIDQTWIKLFNQREFDIIIQGVQSEINIDDLEMNTSYAGASESIEYGGTASHANAFGPHHVTIIHFWRVLRKFTITEKEKFLRFVTSNTRAPLRGFKDLEPPFTILNSLGETDYLPSASTCVNLLKMPPYKTIDVLEAKLREAIETNTFENT